MIDCNQGRALGHRRSAAYFVSKSKGSGHIIKVGSTEGPEDPSVHGGYAPPRRLCETSHRDRRWRQEDGPQFA